MWMDMTLNKRIKWEKRKYEAIYWRKCYKLNSWFQDNLEESDSYYRVVSIDKLKELLIVLPTLVEEDWYFSEYRMRETQLAIEKEIKFSTDSVEFLYDMNC